MDILGNERVVVPDHLLSSRGIRGDHYVLRVIGDAMIEDGILGGDLLVVLRRDEAAPGDMAVVLVGGGSSIKRVYHEGSMVRLASANPERPSILVAAKDVRVQGIVVGLMRKY